MHNTKIRFFINFFNHKFQRYAKNIAFALIASLLLFSCNNAPEWNYPIKTFVKEGFAKADSTDVNYAEQVTVGKIKYVPSGTTIHATAKIRNPQKIAFDAELTLSNALHSAFFVNAIKPFKIKTASGEIVTFEFELKDTADFSSFFAKGADIPVVLKLRKAGTPVEFGKTEFTIHCNTRPLAPTGISSASDNFTINLPTQAIHQDIVLLECVVSAGGTQIKRNIPVASGQTSKTVSVKDFAKGVVVPLKNANGLRSISVTTIDKAGLRSATTTNANGNHTYKSDKALQLSIRSGTGTSLTNISFTNSSPSSNTYVGSVEVFVSDAVLKVMSIGDGATVKCAGVSQVVGTETNVHFDVQDEKVYIYTVTAEDETVFSYKVTVKRIATVAINSATDTWKTLKEAVDGIADGGVITINGEIKATNATDNSGEIEINKNITIKRAVGASSAVLNANGNHSGSAPADAPSTGHRIFKVAEGRTLTLDNLKIKGGEGAVAGDGGGAILAEGNLIMTDCTVTGNKTEYGNGGGIFAKSNLSMTDCIVENNTVNDSTGVGGGIYIYLEGTHIMKDCTVDHNTANYSDGGGIYAMGDLTVEGSTFVYNQAKSNGSGGGIYTTGTLTMKDCDFSNNETVNGNGGGIYTTGTLTITGGTLTNNKVTYGDGGGIYTTGTLTMTDCTLTGNEAVNNKTGGGVYVNGTSFTMKGTSCITPSALSDANKPGKNDVYLASDKMITVNDVLTPAGSIAARITVLNSKYLSTTQVLTGSKVNTEYTKFSVTPKGSEKWSVNEQGKLALMEAAIDAVASPADAWKKFKEAVEFAVDGAVITVNGEVKATNATDNSGEIVIDKNLTIKKADTAATAVLDANKDAGGKPAHRIFKVTSGKTLTLQDLTLKGGKPDASNENGYGGGILLQGGTLDMKNCDVKGNESEGGGGIYARKVGTAAASVTISGGTIGGTDAADANKADGTGTDEGMGGGIYVDEGSTLTMQNDAKVIGNTATQNGGGVYVKNGTATFTMKGSSCITPSSAGDANAAGKNDVYLDNDGGGNIAKISLPEVLSGTAPVVARITIADDQYLSTTQVLDGAAVGTEYAKFTVTPKGNEKWIVAPNGYLQCPKVILRVQSNGNTIKVKAVTSDNSAVTVTGANTSTIGGNGTETTLISIGTTITLNGYITELDCSGTFGVKNNITKLEFDGCALLQKLKCELCLLTTLDVSSLTALKELECFANELTGLNLSGLTALKELNCSSNKLTNLNVSGLTRLQKLECFANELTGLNLSGLTALKELNCSINKFTSLNISGLTGLQELYCTNNKLTSIQMNNNTNLKVLECSINNLTQDAFKQIFIYLPMREPSDKGVCVLYSQKPSDNEGNNMTFTSLPTYIAAKDRNWNMAYIDSSGTQQPIP